MCSVNDCNFFFDLISFVTFNSLAGWMQIVVLWDFRFGKCGICGRGWLKQGTKLLNETIKMLMNVVDNRRVSKNTLKLFWWEVFEQDGQNGGKISMWELRR